MQTTNKEIYHVDVATYAILVEIFLQTEIHSAVDERKLSKEGVTYSNLSNQKILC